jgi:MFS family permease
MSTHGTTIQAKWRDVKQQITKAENSFRRNKLAAMWSLAAVTSTTVIGPLSSYFITDDLAAFRVCCGIFLTSAIAAIVTGTRAAHKYVQLQVLKGAEGSLAEELKPCAPLGKQSKRETAEPFVT